MTKKEIIDYVTETPHNVNKNILGQKLDQYGGNVSWHDLRDKIAYQEMGEYAVKYIPSNPAMLTFFPKCALGDTVTVKIDGVEHSLTVFDDSGALVAGDPWQDFQNGTGQFGWTIFTNDGEYYFFVSLEAHTVSYMTEILKSDCCDLIFNSSITEDAGYCQLVSGDIEAALAKIKRGFPVDAYVYGTISYIKNSDTHTHTFAEVVPVRVYNNKNGDNIYFTLASRELGSRDIPYYPAGHPYA